MRKMHTTQGERLYRFVLIKIFQPDNKKFERQYLRAPGGRGITEDAINRMLVTVADRLDKARPEWDYRVVDLAPNQFNFVCTGPRAA